MACGDPPINGTWVTGFIHGAVGGTACGAGVFPPANPTMLGNVWHGMTQPVFTAPRLSDEDVERIAHRVAELLKASP